jgi:class 3 adenylate cyclase/plastocyanin
MKVKTNKDQYVSGESIHISGIVNPIGSKNTIDIQVYDPTNLPYRHEIAQLNPDGSYNLDLKLGSKTDISGGYTIKASYESLTKDVKFAYANDRFGDKVVVIPLGQYSTMVKSFEPSIVIAQPDNTITWINQDSVPHTATSGDTKTRKADGKFDTNFIPPGKSSTITIKKNDEQQISYFCSLHPWETGIINTNPVKKVSIKEDVPIAEHLDVRVIRSQTDDSEIIETYKKLAKLERHFSDDQIEMLQFNEIAAIKDKTLTIIFWDIHNFSKLSEILRGKPGLLIEFIQEFYSKITQIVFKYGGSVDSHSGDGAVALFGVLSKDEEGRQDAISAVRSAIELRNEFLKLLIKWRSIWKTSVAQYIDIDLKCGINTGTATYGNIGTQKSDQLTAIGGNVNLASRLEGKAAPNKIVISSTTESRVKDHFRVQSLGIYEDLKNIHGEFEIFEVIDYKHSNNGLVI